MSTTRFIVIVLLSCYSALLPAQDSTVYRTESLADINLRFELPQQTWSKANVTKAKNDDKIYTYTRKLFEGAKKKGEATFSIFVEKVKPSTSIKDYSLKNLAFFKQQKNFQIKKAFTDSDGRFTLPYTIGYDASYEDAKGVKHHLYILHTIEFNHAAQLLIDFPFDQQDLYEEEQTQVIKSLRYER